MFGIFSRKPKDKEPERSLGQSDTRFRKIAGNAPRQTDGLANIIVSKSAMERSVQPDNAYDLVQAVKNFVNAMCDRGLYTRLELPTKVFQACHVDYYLAEVNNGGHSQFVHNCHGKLSVVLADVRAGLAAMGAHDHLMICEEMIDWIEANPEEASQQTGFQGGKAKPLQTLDDRFFKLKTTSPLIDLNAAWIRSWPELRIVADEDIGAALDQSAMLNPKREARLAARVVEKLDSQMTDWFLVGVGLACLQMAESEFKLEIYGNGIGVTLEGQVRAAIGVRTTANKTRYCVVTDEFAAAFERTERATLGQQLSYVSRETIAGIIELARQCKAGVALDLMLRKARLDQNKMIITPMAIRTDVGFPIIECAVISEDKLWIALFASHRSIIVDPHTQAQLTTVNKEEILEHAAKIEAEILTL